MAPNLFPTNRKKGFVIYSRATVDHRTPATDDVQRAPIARKAFYRLYYQGGLLTLERYRVANRVFLSFHYKPDWQRVRQIRTMRKRGDAGKVFAARQWRIGFGRDREESWASRAGKVATDSEWEEIKRDGNTAIRRWIDGQMKRKGCIIVIIGSNTANRPWVNYEIKEGWNDRKGVVGVYVHNLKDGHGKQSPMGENPFEYLTIGGRPMSEVVKVHDPPFQDSAQVRAYIEQHLSSWVGDAIKVRSSVRDKAAYSSKANTVK
jgi:hypothetical protein